MSAGQPATNGWDAICALNAQEVNRIFFQQYLQEGPVNWATRLRVILPSQGTSLCLLDIVLGPPQVTFPADLSLQQVQITMFLVRGALIEFDSKTLVIESAVVIEPNESWLTGPVSLGKLSGEGSTLGQVFVDLGTGAYKPQITGLDPDSVLANDIGTALQTYFADQATKYPLGSLNETNVSACLQPTSFDFVTQPAPAGAQGDGCVLLLIRTTGGGGAVGQLDPYPLPSGQTVALIVSNKVIFDQLVPSSLTKAFSQIGTTFTGSQVGGAWVTSGDGGSINVGRISGESDLTSYWTQDDQYGDETPLVVPIRKFTVNPEPTGLAVSWQYSWSQGWGWYPAGSKGGTDWDQVSMALSCQFTAPAAVDSTTDVVSFPAHTSVGVTYEHSSGWKDVFGDGSEADAAGAMIADHLRPSLATVLQDFQLPDINTFALANLLFPDHHVSLQEVTVPCDLLLTGQLEQALTVSPPTIELAPGQTQQFNATVAGQPVTDVLWEREPEIGSIDGSGNYAAPAQVTQPEVVVVTAVSQSNANLAGRAMVLVHGPPTASGLVVSPANLILTAGQSFEVLVTDERGTPVAARCALNPNLGQITAGWGTGKWTYTAPSTVTESTTVTVTATSTANAGESGTSTVKLARSEAIQIAPSSGQVAPGGTLRLRATSTDLEDYSWQIYPTESGSIARDDSDSSQATYSAPAKVTDQTDVMVTAYSLGDSVGIGSAHITVGPP
jgi:hypothetical protein